MPGAEYREKTRQLIEMVRTQNSETEILLMATSLPNPILHTPPFTSVDIRKSRGGSERTVRKRNCAGRYSDGAEEYHEKEAIH